ncbi:hypothetical protein ElyMa_005804700 [Elysia marginata]|uniref:Uncharacterized protein n=1 Tax=Elysia marginata TaxID=1093978 RepID=A0AAV4FU76_9GAST|nr:hypothetical protein ElyMa_005804700 [Elysia marginata]
MQLTAALPSGDSESAVSVQYKGRNVKKIKTNMFQSTCILFMFLVAACRPIAGIPNPIHASCELDWNVGVDCKTASDKLIQQIDAWKGDDCGSSEKCLYSFDSFDGKVLKAKHTTPKAHYVDDLKMVFSANGNECAIHDLVWIKQKTSVKKQMT